MTLGPGKSPTLSGYPLKEGDILGVSHVSIHHESQEWGVTPLQVIHTSTVGNMPVAVNTDSA